MCRLAVSFIVEEEGGEYSVSGVFFSLSAEEKERDSLCTSAFFLSVCVCVYLMSLILGTLELCTERQQPKLIMTAKPAPDLTVSRVLHILMETIK